MLLKPFQLHLPTTLSEAVQLQSELKDVKILAGGTFLLNTLKHLKKKGTKYPQHLLSLNKIDELKGIHSNSDSNIVTLGAMTSISEIYESSLLKGSLNILKTVCRNVATQPVRNMATLGGNLTCRYTWTEMGAVMIALDANFHFAGPHEQEETLAAEDFFNNAAKTSQILSHVSINNNPSAVISYQRIKKTMHIDIPLLALCIKTEFRNNHFYHTRVAVNNGIAFAQRDTTLENFLNKSPCQKTISQEALDHLNGSIYDERSDDYKRHMFRVCIKKAIGELRKKGIEDLRICG